ncbi:MAG: RDD family protein, partial [Acidobacteriota bacterium]
VPFLAALTVLACCALTQLALVPFKTTCSHALFRIAVVDATGERAGRARLLGRWAIAWLPLVAALALAAAWESGLAGPGARAALALWLVGVAAAALDGHRGPHDRRAGTWVVRR